MKNLNYPIRNQTHDLRLVAQCLNQLRRRENMVTEILFSYTTTRTVALIAYYPLNVGGSFLGVNEPATCRTYSYNPNAQVKKGGVMVRTLSAMHRYGAVHVQTK
jgi:hypothetical protein